MALTVIQTLPALDVGGVERGTLDVAAELVRQGHRSIVISGGGRLVKKLTDEGSEHILLPIGKKSLTTLKYIKPLRHIISDNNAAVLHSRSRLPAWISYLAWRKMDPSSRPRFVTTVHGPYTVNPYSKIMVRGERVIAVSEFIRSYILKNYPDIPEHNIKVIHRGVSPDEFPYQYSPSSAWLDYWKRTFPNFTNKFLVTLPARVTRWKGHEDFLEIIEQAVADDLPVHGLVAGGPHSGKEAFFELIQSKTIEKGLAEHITFLGHRNDLKDIMAISNVVFSLAKIPEAFGRTALEALCIGKPVIAYNHGGAAEILREIFPEGRVRPNDTFDAFQKLKAFIKDTPRVNQHNPFTLQNMLDNTIALYEEVTREKHT